MLPGYGRSSHHTLALHALSGWLLGPLPVGRWLSGVPLLGGQVFPSTVSPGAVVRDRKATTFAMPPSKGIRALDFSVVTLLRALVCYASA